MTSLRWDNVPKPRVERPPFLAPSSKSARREQKPASLKDRIEEAGGARTGLHDLAGSARAAARAASANRGSGRCSSCKARGVTLWQVTGSLVCGNCRGEMWAEYHRSSQQAPASTQRKSPSPGKRTDLRARLPLATSAWHGYGTFSASSTRRRRSGTPGGDDFGLSGQAGGS